MISMRLRGLRRGSGSALLALLAVVLVGVSAAPQAVAAATGHLSVHLDALAPGSTGPLSSGTFVNGRVVRTVVIDGGTMILRPPPPDSHPALGHASAVAEAAAATTATPGAIDPAGTALGSVYVAPAAARTANARSHQLAWVTVIRPQIGVSCPATDDDPAEPSLHVLVLSASGSAASIYSSRGTGPCGGAIHPPTLAPASKIESISWHGLSSAQVSTSPPSYMWTISYQVPPCGSVFDSPGIQFVELGVPTLFVQTMAPLVPSRQCVEPKASTSVFGPEDVPVDDAQHAPLGLNQF